MTNMREIKFKGKSTKTGQWVYGWHSFVRNHTDSPQYPVISYDDGRDGWRVEIFPESVAQWTGLKDKKNREVYDGDILADEEAHYKVYWCEELLAYDLERLEDCSNMKGFGCYENDIISEIIKDSIIIGNIYENPELLTL